MNIFFSDLLKIRQSFTKVTTATISDLKIREKVAIFETDNSDASVMAQNVQLNPIQRMGGGSRNSSGPTDATGAN